MKSGILPRGETARPTSADMMSMQKEGIDTRIGQIVKVDNPPYRGYGKVSSESGAVFERTSGTAAGVLVTRGDRTNPRLQDRQHADCIIALSGPVTIKDEFDKPGVKNKNALECEVDLNANERRIHGKFLPSVRNVRYKGKGDVPFTQLNYLLYDREGKNYENMKRKDVITKQVEDRVKELAAVKGGKRPKKYSSVLSAHPFDVVCVKKKDSNICIGDLVVLDGTTNVAGRMVVKSILDSVDVKDTIVGVAITTKLKTEGKGRKHEEIPIRVGGIVSLNNSYECLDFGGGPEVGTKYLQEAPSLAPADTRHTVIQPIRFMKESTALSRPLVFHARIGSTCM